MYSLYSICFHKASEDAQELKDLCIHQPGWWYVCHKGYVTRYRGPDGVWHTPSYQVEIDQRSLLHNQNG